MADQPPTAVPPRADPFPGKFFSFFFFVGFYTFRKRIMALCIEKDEIVEKVNRY